MSSLKAGVGLADILLIIFIVLKLIGIITWSWIWVLSPAWISLLIYFLAYLSVKLDNWW